MISIEGFKKCQLQFYMHTIIRHVYVDTQKNVRVNKQINTYGVLI